MAEFSVGQAVQVGTAPDARHGVVTALVTESDGAQSYDVAFSDGGPVEARVREGDLAPVAGTTAAQPDQSPATLLAEAATLVQQAESEVSK